MIPEKKYSVIIVAGGKGLRVGGELPKQFQRIGTKPTLMHTIDAFYQYDYRMRIIVVLPEGFREYWDGLCREYDFSVPHKNVMGGETRFHSVKNGLTQVSEDEVVGIHDAARAFVSPNIIERCFGTAFRDQCGVIPVIREMNSVRRITGSGSRAVDRDLLRIVQTPQVFPAGLLKKAYETDFDPAFTDDASVAEAFGIEIRLVEGDVSNIKLTTPFDMKMAEWLLDQGSKL